MECPKHLPGHLPERLHMASRLDYPPHLMQHRDSRVSPPSVTRDGSGHHKHLAQKLLLSYLQLLRLRSTSRTTVPVQRHLQQKQALGSHPQVIMDQRQMAALGYLLPPP